MIGFIFPNEVTVEWGLLIVIYPYITGLVAGAFIVSSLYHVFNLTSLKPVARLSLITALAFLLVSPLPLIIHLGRPERALEMFLRPNLISAMSGFGYIWLFYLLLMLTEVWLVFRPDIIALARSSGGVKQRVYSVLTLGVYEISDEAGAIDKKLIKILAIIGIPAACLLHGYVGFIFGAIKANPWWSTPLMPIIFLLSAIVSGIALLMVTYVTVTKIRGKPLDYNCVRSLALWLGGFFTVALSLEGLEVLSMLYEAEESWEMIRFLITQKIYVSYFIIQFSIGSLVPLVLLAVSEFTRLSETHRMPLRFLASFIILIGVFAMRWNVVIGGQLLSKSFRGFTTFIPELWGEGGILASTGLMILPFILLSVLINMLPIWPEDASAVERKRLSF